MTSSKSTLINTLMRTTSYVDEGLRRSPFGRFSVTVLLHKAGSIQWLRCGYKKQLDLTTKCFMSVRSPTEDEN